MATKTMVFVPGILGSELWLGDDKIWPGSGWEALNGFSSENFTKLLRPDLEPRDIVRAAVGGLVGIYQSWIDAFEAIVKDGKPLFVETPPSGGRKTLHVFPYDWRQNLQDTVTVFADFLDGIVTAHADAELHLACHSLGGLLARYYLESGRFAARPAMAKIATLITFGTPHNGAPIALAGIAGLHKTNFLSLQQSRQLANHPNFPSLYQTLPAATQFFIWDADRAKAHKTYAVDDAKIVAAAALLPASLAAWKSFRNGLTGEGPAHVRYFYFVGSRQTTMTRFLLRGARLEMFEIESGGDGTVPLLEAVDTSVQTELVGKSHVTLIETRAARAALAGLFGADTLFSADELAVKIVLTVRDPSVAAGEDIHLLIEFEQPVTQLRGTLYWERTPTPAQGALAPMVAAFAKAPNTPEIRIELAGPQVNYINCVMPPIETRGVYRPALRLDADPDSVIVGNAFAVQDIVER